MTLGGLSAEAHLGCGRGGRLAPTPPPEDEELLLLDSVADAELFPLGRLNGLLLL